MTTTEQRRTARRQNDLSHELAAALREYASDVSPTGVFIRTHDLLPVGTQVQLRFTVIVDDFETIEGEGRVVRVSDRTERPGLGIEFVELTEASREALARYCRRTLTD